MDLLRLAQTSLRVVHPAGETFERYDSILATAINLEVRIIVSKSLRNLIAEL